METRFPDSQLAVLGSLSSTSSAAVSEFDLQQAWHLLSLLLYIGRPTPPQVLASYSSLFNATPDLVRFLCSVPHSPISLTADDENNDFVTVSSIGLLAFKRFASNFNLFEFIPWIRFELQPPGLPRNNVVRMYFRKRKRIGFDSGNVEEKYREGPLCLKRIRRYCSEFHVNKDIQRSLFAEASRIPTKPNNTTMMPDSFIETADGNIGCKLNDIEKEEIEMCVSMVAKTERKTIMGYELDQQSAFPSAEDGPAVIHEVRVDDVNHKSEVEVDTMYDAKDIKKVSTSPVEFGRISHVCNAAKDGYAGKMGMECKEAVLNETGKTKEGNENLCNTSRKYLLDMPLASDYKRTREMSLLDKEPMNTHAEPSVAQKQLSNSSIRKKVNNGDGIASRQQDLSLFSSQSSVVTLPKNTCKKDHKPFNMVQGLNKKCEDIQVKKVRKEATFISSKDQMGPKELPCFEPYIVEEEEGSGGYGTVYRARSKNDGTVVAIKCPHANAPKHHINNELRMLERFGGKNFVIKYKGRFKSGDSECFVLEHVEHDRPEVLKKEIDVFHLQWYGYCLFRALASLHKQGIVHRDVKPGNFLFSCKSAKGYLIDFNLAMDLHQKCRTSKLKVKNDVNFSHASPKSVPLGKSGKIPSVIPLNAIYQGRAKASKSTLEPKSLKKKAEDQAKPRTHNDFSGWNILKGQRADGSGITSIKDVTSTRTPSAERLREPLPCQGRKELISLLHGAMQTPNHEASSVSSSMRKRIAASPEKVGGSFIYLTPMPLHPAGITVNGEGKHKKEGLCVGTKGFRAPEVLFRSLHQGPKLDIWSAGVTLLYLMIGRTPFYGDPEQNIKDIAKLRGSEDLWEVAKLHDRESSFPVELFDTRFLPSVTLLEWCKMNTKRRDFLELFPSSLIDLVDKCLTVNPRARISAEDALKHEFFAPCHESLRKQKLLRQRPRLDSDINLLKPGQGITRT